MTVEGVTIDFDGHTHISWRGGLFAPIRPTQEKFWESYIDELDDAKRE